MWRVYLFCSVYDVRHVVRLCLCCVVLLFVLSCDVMRCGVVVWYGLGWGELGWVVVM